MSHHQIPRLDGDQTERCDGNLPFASRLMAVLSMTGHWAGQVLSKAEFHFGGSSNGGFWSRKVENALTLSPPVPFAPANILPIGLLRSLALASAHALSFVFSSDSRPGTV